MALKNIDRPAETEYPVYFGKYIEKVNDGNILETLSEQLNDTLSFFQIIPEEKETFRYAPEKWSIREVVGHMLDTERVFNYRALRFARNDKTVLHGFEENDYIRNATFNDYPLSELAEAFASVRIATLSLFIHMDEAAWLRRGVAFKGEMSVRAIAWIIAGHELHHRSILHEKYIL